MFDDKIDPDTRHIEDIAGLIGQYATATNPATTRPTYTYAGPPGGPRNG